MQGWLCGVSLNAFSLTSHTDRNETVSPSRPCPNFLLNLLRSSALLCLPHALLLFDITLVIRSSHSSLEWKVLWNLLSVQPFKTQAKEIHCLLQVLPGRAKFRCKLSHELNKIYTQMRTQWNYASFIGVQKGSQFWDNIRRNHQQAEQLLMTDLIMGLFFYCSYALYEYRWHPNSLSNAPIANSCTRHKNYRSDKSSLLMVS